MKLSEIDFGGAQPPIDGYAPGGFRIRGAFYEGALLLSPAGIDAWAIRGLADLAEPAAIAALTALAADVDAVLIGTGAEMTPLPGPARQALEAAGVGADPMATPSACRTYNVLLSENRRVAAALLAV